MKTFIRVVELWVPDRTRTKLEFGGCLCSEEYSEFKAVSENALFAYDEGLPGKAWASGHPVILTKFANSYFKRTDEALEAGLTCGVALPVFAGEFLMAVMVLFCGDDEKHVGAIELWHNDAERSHEMALVDGYYGTADMFEFNSRHTKFPKGFGLPGRTWKAGMPLIIKDLHNSKAFLRWEEATEIGINCGVGIPYRTISRSDLGDDVPVGAGDPDCPPLRNLGSQRSAHRAGVSIRRLQQECRSELALCREGDSQGRRLDRRRLGHRHARDQRASQARRHDRLIAGARVRHGADRGVARDRGRAARRRCWPGIFSPGSPQSLNTKSRKQPHAQ